MKTMRINEVENVSERLGKHSKEVDQDVEQIRFRNVK